MLFAISFFVCIDFDINIYYMLWTKLPLKHKHHGVLGSRDWSPSIILTLEIATLCGVGKQCIPHRDKIKAFKYPPATACAKSLL